MRGRIPTAPLHLDSRYSAMNRKENAEELRFDSELLCVPFFFSASSAVKLLVFVCAEDDRRYFETAANRLISVDIMRTRGASFAPAA